MTPEMLGYLVLGLGTVLGLFFMIYTPINNVKMRRHDKELTDKLTQQKKDHEEEITRMQADALISAQAVQTTADNTAAMQMLTIELKHQSELWADAIRKNSETHGFFRKKFEDVDDSLAGLDKRVTINEKELVRLGQYHPPERRKLD